MISQLTTIISIILNIIFLILLFFKSTLNYILKDWWISRKKNKEIGIKRLIEFKSKFYLLSSQCSLLMISTAQKQTYLIKGRTADQHVEDTYQESLSKSADARNAIAEFIDYLPADLINKYNKHEEQYLDMIRKIYEGAISQEEIIAFSEERTSLSLEIIDLVDSILAKKLKRN